MRKLEKEKVQRAREGRIRSEKVGDKVGEGWRRSEKVGERSDKVGES